MDIYTRFTGQHILGDPSIAVDPVAATGLALVNAFAAFGIIKYGLWTVIFWSLHWQSGGSVTFENIAMTFTHLIMAGEGLLLLGYTRLTTKVAIGLGGWFIFNDLIDYGPVQTRPGLPPSVAVSTMMWVAFALTLTLAGLYLWLAKKRETA